MSKIRSVGVLGLGSFGKLITNLLPKDTELLGHDSENNIDIPGIRIVSLEEVVNVDVLILSIPLSSYPELLPKISSIIRPDTLIMDICSVKTQPEKLINKYFTHEQPVLITHPLFGPQSVKDGTDGHRLIVTSKRGERAQQVIDFCKSKLKLRVSEMSAENHDKIMAQIHVLTFFIARGLAEIGLVDTPFETPSYKMIKDLISFDESHSEELFDTIQKGNPYGAKIREDLIKSLERTNNQLEKLKKS